MSLDDALRDLVDDAAAADGGRTVELAVADRPASPGPQGLLVLRDDQLAAAGRGVGAADPVPIVVRATAGAGGLLALARRDLPGVDVRVAVSVLRDLDDLAGNASRVVAAAAELPVGWEVSVELPYAPGWWNAAEAVEAAGLWGQVRGDVAPEQLAEQLSMLVEADLPFRVVGVADGLAVVRLLLAVEALVEVADVADAVALLGTDPDRVGVALRQWDAATAGRIRRRVRAVEVSDAAAVAADLARLSSRG